MSHGMLAVISGGIFVGAVDAAAAITLNLLNGIIPIRTWQFVASALIGSRSFELGKRAAILGLVLHFVVAFGVTTAFVVFVPIVPMLVIKPILSGAIYGVAVFLVMRFIVSLSAAPKRKSRANQIIGQMLIHICCIGVPIALISKHFLG